MLTISLLAAGQEAGQRVDSLLTVYTAQHKFNGAVLIAKNGKVILEKAYGFADQGKNQLNSLQTEFRAGSLTKMFTSTIILQLVEKGKIKLDDKLSKYVPAFPNGSTISIKNLLSHTSGVQGNTAPGASTIDDLVNGFKSDPLAFTPGERFEYNNFNYILLGYVAQKVTGKPYANLVKTNIFDKVGMTHSGFDYKGRISSDKAVGYALNPETRQPEKFEGNGDVAAAASAGALYTTIHDLYKWSQAVSSHTLLSESTYKLAFTPVMDGYGLGWIVGKNNGHDMVGHTGSIEGFMADFKLFPKDHVTIIFLSNLGMPIDYHISDILTAILFNKPFAERKDKVTATLALNILEKYVGTYELNGDKMVVSINHGKLEVLAPGGDTAELTPESENKFFVNGPEVGVEFKTIGDKQAMFVDMRGGMTFIKVE